MSIDPQAFIDTPEPPASAPLRALWFDARGDWGAAHRCVEELCDPDAMWVHAYLHRKEGDATNAFYWYARAGKSPCIAPLATEWREILAAQLGRVVP